MVNQGSNGVVIVGAGQAAAWVAITVRGLAPDTPFVVIGDEPHPPYERPPLSKKILAGQSEINSAYIRPPEFYAENNIQLLLSRRVNSIDRDSCEVVLSDGTRIGYGALVLATGCRARRIDLPGADGPHVHVLRSAADVDAIRPKLSEGKRVVAIGAGFIGLEVAAVARRAGCVVEVIESAPQPMGRVIDPAVAKVIADIHAGEGVVLRCSTAVTAIEDAGDHAEVVLGNGDRVQADLIVMGVGAVPNDELAEAAGVVCNDGVVVDEFGRSSDPDIHAVGDVTQHFNPLLGRRLRLESYQNAQNQGVAVGKVIMGGAEPYAEIPWFWTDQYDTNFQIIGAPLNWDRVVWRGDPASGKATAIYMSGDKIVAGNTLNNARDIRFLRQLILSGTPVADAEIADLAVNLGKLMVIQATK